MLEFDIIEKNVPTVYEIGVGDDSHSLNIRTDNSALAFVNDALKDPNHRWINSLRKELGLSNFFCLSDQNWGFGKAFTKVDIEENQTLWECSLPKGNRNGIKWDALNNISSSLMVMLLGLNLYKETTNAQNPQLMCLHLNISRGINGGAMGAYFGRSIIPWLEKQPNNSGNEEIEQTMRRTYMYLSGDRIKQKDSFLYRFQAWMRQPCWINLTCPGDACGLDPRDYNNPESCGYELLPHNIDSSLQQLTFVMGLAKMHDLARKDGF